MNADTGQHRRMQIGIGDRSRERVSGGVRQQKLTDGHEVKRGSPRHFKAVTESGKESQHSEGEGRFHRSGADNELHGGPVQERRIGRTRRLPHDIGCPIEREGKRRQAISQKVDPEDLCGGQRDHQVAGGVANVRA